MSEQQLVGTGYGDVYLPGGRVGYLLVHGFGGTPAEVRLVAQGLNRAGHTVLCPLLRGHGGSELLLGTTRWAQWKETVDRAFDELKMVCDTIFVAGQSAGALLAIHVASERRDDIAGLVLYSPTFTPNGWAIPWSFNLFRLVQDRLVANLFKLPIPQTLGVKDERRRTMMIESQLKEGRTREDIQTRRGTAVLEFRRLAASARRRLGRVTVPTLVIHSREDDQADPSNALLAVRDIKGPTELVLLDDSYHLITLDRQANEVTERTLAFGARRLDVIEKVRARAAFRRDAQKADGDKSRGTSFIGLADVTA